MKLRANLFINGRESSVAFFQGPQELEDHLFLKLAASILFFEQQAFVQSGPSHPALQGQEFYPDLMATDFTGQMTLWVECGKTTMHKLDRVSKRFRGARLVVLTALPHQARQQANDIAAEGLRNIEVWSFPERTFAQWSQAAREQNDVIGESTSSSMNLVLNGSPFVIDFERIEARS